MSQKHLLETLPSPHDYLTQRKEGLFSLAIKVSPSSFDDLILKSEGGYLWLKVKAKAEKNLANQAVLKLLATTLSCPKAFLSLRKGHKNSHKLIDYFPPLKKESS